MYFIDPCGKCIIKYPPMAIKQERTCSEIPLRTVRDMNVLSVNGNGSCMGKSDLVQCHCALLGVMCGEA